MSLFTSSSSSINSIAKPSLLNENKHLSGSIDDIINAICTIVKKMNWSYRDNKDNRILFTQEETKPLIATFTWLKKCAEKSKMSSYDLAEQSLPILLAYYEVTEVQGLSQFQSRIVSLQDEKELLGSEEFERQEMTLTAQIAAYRQDATKYTFNHMRNKFDLDQNNSRGTTEEEYAFCSFLACLREQLKEWERPTFNEDQFNLGNSSDFEGDSCESVWGSSELGEGINDMNLDLTKDGFEGDSFESDWSSSELGEGIQDMNLDLPEDDF